ncbi:MAG: gamma-glutamylcyclotransferase family protein [Bacteroidota bacterium]
MELLFVYGTLMKGIETNITQYLRANSRFLGIAYTHGRLYDLGSYPGLVCDASTEAKVTGHVYELTAAEDLWPFLDRYEGYDPARPELGQYRRQICEAYIDGKILSCHTYHFQQSTEGLVLIPNGDYLQYLQQRPDNHVAFINRFQQ